MDKLVEAIRGGERVVLVSQLLDHILKPLAKHFGVESIIANRLDFRDGIATGRLLDPVVRPRGPLAWVASGSTDGRITRREIAAATWLESESPELPEAAMQSSSVGRQSIPTHRWRCLEKAREWKNFRCVARWRSATSC